MSAAPLPICTVTSVVAVVTLPCVLGVPAAKPAVQLWALGAATSNNVLTHAVGEDIFRGC